MGQPPPRRLSHTVITNTKNTREWGKCLHSRGAKQLQLETTVVELICIWKEVSKIPGALVKQKTTAGLPDADKI